MLRRVVLWFGVGLAGSACGSDVGPEHDAEIVDVGAELDADDPDDTDDTDDAIGDADETADGAADADLSDEAAPDGCVPGAKACAEAMVIACGEDRQWRDLVDCAATDLTCTDGECRAPDACGDGVCEPGEDCPHDCRVCVPEARRCDGDRLAICAIDATRETFIDCAALGLVCAAGDCRAAGICGNGRCDGSEVAASCPEDCTQVCGDGLCRGTESFERCAADCAPVCGDLRCQGDEPTASCADCAVGCGDGTCGEGEDRGTCARDCGTCGDGQCQPEESVATCRVDCTPEPCACGGDELCLADGTCCADGDGDGHADLGCGGDDCDDGDASTHPGASEPCAGGDKNCNGLHRFARGTASVLSAGPGDKRELVVADVGDGWIVGYGGAHLTLVAIERDLRSAERVTDLALAPGRTRVGLAWSTARARLGAFWADAAGGSRAAWLTRDGVIDGNAAVIPADDCDGTPYTAIALGAAALDGSAIFSVAGVSGDLPARAAGVFRLDDGVTRAWGAACGGTGAPAFTRPVAFAGRLFGLAATLFADPPMPGTIVVLDPGGAAAPVVVARSHPSQDGECALGVGGDGPILMCLDNRLYRHRLDPTGAIAETSVVMNARRSPLAIGAGALGGQLAVATALRHQNGELWLDLRDAAGAELVAAGPIGGEAGVATHVLFDGGGFVVLWLADAGGVAQVFAEAVTCE